jgi:hypothetical protein
VQGITEINIYHYIICELLSQCSWGWKSLVEHIQLKLIWYNSLLIGYCQKSIQSIQYPIMVVAVSHKGWSVLALQPLLSILSHASSFHHFIIFSSFSPLLSSLSSFCPHFTLSYLFKISWFVCRDFYVVVSSSFSHLSFSLFSSLFIFLSCLNTSFEFSLNLFFKLYYLHQNMCGRYGWYPQIMDWFHDIYVSDHLVILIKCLFKFEVGRKWERWYVINFYHNFFKIK